MGALVSTLYLRSQVLDTILKSSLCGAIQNGEKPATCYQPANLDRKEVLERDCYIARSCQSFSFLKECMSRDPNANPRTGQEWIVTKGFLSSEQVCLRRFGILFPGLPIRPLLLYPPPALPVLLPLYPPALQPFYLPSIRLYLSSLSPFLLHILVQTGHLKCSVANVQH